MRPGPLHGYRVVDCSTVLAGPYCTMVLADLGASVVKVEPPEGDSTRGWGPPWLGEGADRTAAYYLAINRGKRSIRLDLRMAEGRGVLRDLLARADAFVENFRPGGLARLGFGDDELARINPALVHLAITGYGPDGPDAAKPGYDFIAQAGGGLMSITGLPDAEGGQPTKVGVAVSDVTTGLFGAIGLLAALLGRERESVAAGAPGRTSGPAGPRVDVSLLESTLALLINQAQNAFVTGQTPARRGNSHPNIVPYETFDTADRQIVVAVGSERQWPRFCEALGLAELADDPRFRTNAARVSARRELRPMLAARFRERPAEAWLRELEAADVPCGPINDVLTALESPQARARGMNIVVEHPRLGRIRQVGSPITVGSAGERAARISTQAPPALGEHTAEVLAELDYDAAAIERLSRLGVT